MTFASAISSPQLSYASAASYGSSSNSLAAATSLLGADQNVCLPSLNLALSLKLLLPPAPAQQGSAALAAALNMSESRGGEGPGDSGAVSGRCDGRESKSKSDCPNAKSDPCDSGKDSKSAGPSCSDKGGTSSGPSCSDKGGASASGGDKGGDKGGSCGDGGGKGGK